MIYVSDSIGMNVFKCELCKMVFADQPTLLTHYQAHHQLDFMLAVRRCETEDMLKSPTPPPPPPPPTSQPIKIPTQAAAVPSPPTKPTQSSSSKRRKSVQKERKDTEEEEHIQHSIKQEHVVDEGSQSEAESKALDNQDFAFILSTETIKGAKLTFTRSWFKCLHCDFKSRMKRCLLKHMQERHVETFASVHDNLEVKTDEGYNLDQKVGETHSRVMRMSTYDRLYPIMGRKRKRRIEKQDIPGVYNCSQCNKVFSRLRYLRKHSKQHILPPAQKLVTGKQPLSANGEKRFTCEQCGKSFKFKHYLQVHIRSHNNKMFQCNECDFQSDINAAIHAHRQVHNQGSVLCDICGYAYSDRSTLSKHLRVHDMSRPYACTFPSCTWRFKTEMMCRAHVRAHTTEGKFRCWLCGYLFRHKHHLQRHVSKMHKLKLSVKEIDAKCKSQQQLANALSAAAASATQPSIPIEADINQQLLLQCKDCCLEFDSKEDLEQHFTKFHHVQLSVKDLDDFCHMNALNNTTDPTDPSKLVITATINPTQNYDQNALAGVMDTNGSDQPVYVAIDHSALAHLEGMDTNSAVLDQVVNQVYIQEEQEVPITDEMVEDPEHDKAYFVSVL